MIPDLSHYHPVRDWNAAKVCDFIIYKATQGTKNIDSTMAKFVEGCEKHNIKYWLYCYLNVGNEVAQVKHMLSTCTPIIGKNFVGYVLDVEAGNSADNIDDALQYLERNTDCKCGIYTMYSQYWKYANVLEHRAPKTFWWEARYGVNDGVYRTQHASHAGVDLHQYTSNGKGAIASGALDLNRLTGAKPVEWFVTTNNANDFPMNKPEPTPIATPTVKNGTRGANAKLLQQNLNAFGYKLAEDGIIGAKSVSALKAWQKKNGLVSDGIYGKNSAAKMAELSNN